jgi:peptidoglycan/LPS O-acetylase OafA/YrhL
MQAGDRVHYMDNLRALAMLAGVVFHAALAYSPLMHPVWPLADAGGSIMVDVVAWFPHLFRMPLFFVIAGFFAALLVARRGMGGLFRNRTARVLLPLALFLPLVLASIHWLTLQAAANVAHPSPALAWMRGWIAQHGSLPSLPGWAHLWFLFYLLLFTVLTWVASTLGSRRIGERIAALPPLALAMLFPLPLSLALAGTSVPWPAPEFVLPSLWAMAFFGLYFALGYQVFERPSMLDRLRPLSMPLLSGAVLAYALLFRSTDGFALTRPTTLQHATHAALQAYAGLWMTLWCLLAGKRWLDQRNAAMRWLADASYWTYLVHLPLLFAIQYRLLDVSLHWMAKFAIAVLATFAVALASYQLLVRHTTVGRLLNGKRPSTRQHGAGS